MRGKAPHSISFRSARKHFAGGVCMTYSYIGQHSSQSTTHMIMNYIALVKVLSSASLQWRQNERDGVSNLRPVDGLLNRLFRRRSKKTSKLPVTRLCEGNSLVNSPHIGPVTRKMLPFDDVIMSKILTINHLGRGLSNKIYIKTYDSSNWFFNMGSEWLVAVLPANPKPGLKMIAI